MNASAQWAAGVYIRERSISCLIGEVIHPGVRQLAPRLAPKTRNRKKITIPDVTCSDREPAAALEECARLIGEAVRQRGIDLRAVHIACFGGFVSIKPSDKGRAEKSGYGRLTNVSAYPRWDGINLYLTFRDALAEYDVRPQIDVGTDVDAAAYGEYLYEARDLPQQKRAKFVNEKTLVCLSFSRTINGGIVRKGELWAGEGHPTMSIIRPPRYTVPDGKGGSYLDLYEGNCRFHRDCIEGLIGASALEERTGLPFEDIPASHHVWEVFAYYAAQLCIYVVGILKPSAIVLTGRSIRQLDDLDFADGLVKRIRGHFYSRLTNGEGEYRPDYPELMNKGDFIRLPRPPAETLRGGGRLPGLPGRHGALRLAASEVVRQA